MQIECRLAEGAKSTVYARGRKLTGLAAPYNVRTKIGTSFDEQIAAGAFRSILATKPDVAFLRDHNPSLIMGRTASGTLQLKETPQGLTFSVELPETEAARDLLTSVERGDVAGCSFGFMVNPQDESWEMDGKTPLRTIRSFSKLVDVSAVTYPAYSNTEVAARMTAVSAEVRSAAMACLNHEIVNAEVKQFVTGLLHDANAVARRRKSLLDSILN